MPQFPFRSYNTGDGDPPEWQPPDYATSVGDKSDDDEWKPPEYATAIGKKEDKKPSGYGEIWKKISEPITEAPTKFAEKVSEYINPERTVKGIRGIGSAYIEGLGHTISGLSSPLNLALTAATGGAGATESAFPRVASALRTGSRVLSAPIAAEGAIHAHKGLKDRDLSEFLSGILEAGTGALGMRSSHASAKIPEETLEIKELPIRQSREIPYRMG